MWRVACATTVFALGWIGLATGRGVPAERSLALDAATSRVVIHVGKSGAFGFAGHEHQAIAQSISGQVLVDADDWTRSSVSLQLGAAGLHVSGQGEPAQDVPRVQQVMAGNRVLDVDRFPTITFRSNRVALKGRSGSTVVLEISGELTLHGVTRPLTLTAATSVDPSGGVSAKGHFPVKQTEFGIEPVTAAGGTVRVKDTLDVEFDLHAR